MLTVENVGNQIYLFGREQSGESYVKVDKEFRPYFYYVAPGGQYNTIDGKNAVKVTCENPKEVIEVREKYRQFGLYEADIVYANRYIIDKIDKIEKEPIRICHLDIEIKRTKNGYEGPEVAMNPIITIGCYDTFDNEYKQFWVSEEKNEKQMIGEFIQYIREKDPDIITAWNGDAFDFPFIINRMRKIGMNPKDLSRMNGEVYTTEWGAHIFGRILLDLLQVYKVFISNAGRESWSLEYVSKYELKEKGGKEKYKGELDDLFEKDINKFLAYNKRDVELLYLLDKELRLIDFFDEVRRLCNCKFEDVFMNGRVADGLCLKFAKEHKFVLPISHQVERNKYEGAFVKSSEPKLHKMVAVMDMKSLYPSIMIGFNTSYETILPSYQEGCINIDNRYFFKQESGIIPSIVRPLLDERNKYKKLASKAKEEFGKKSREFQTLDMTQYALKIIANSFYGVMGSPYYRLYNRDVAQCITYTAQKIIKEIMNWFETKNYRVVYGDTDSVFINMNETDINGMINLNTEVNRYFRDYFKQFGVTDDKNIFELQFEKVYKTLFFKRKNDGEGAKKKYAGRMIWKGEPTDEISITGFESRRSDTPTAGRELIANVLKMIVYETPKEEIDKFVDDFKIKLKKGEFQPEDIAMPTGISKPLDKYGNQIHAVASRKANEKHKAQIKGGDKIKWLYVKGPERVMAFKTYMYDGYQIDYDKMTQRIVDMKIGPMYESLGWDYKYLELHRKKEVSFEDTLKQMGLWI